MDRPEILCGLILQNGLADKIERSRKQIKERKNRSKKIRGVKKNAGKYWFCVGAQCHVLRSVARLCCIIFSSVLGVCNPVKPRNV